MEQGAAVRPIPDKHEIEAALAALGAPIPVKGAARALLAGAIAWLESDRPRESGAIEQSIDFFFVTYQPAVEALWTAFEVYGLPAYRPDYVDWLTDDRAKEMADGSAIEREDLDTLQLYVQTLDQAERFCAGYWADCIREGGFLREMRLLQQLVEASPPNAP